MQETIDMRGELYLQLIDADGQIVHQQHRKNRIVTGGRQLVAQMFAGRTDNTLPKKVTSIGVGDDGTEPSDGDTALLKERIRKPIQSVEYTEYDELVSGKNVRRVRVKVQTELDYEEANNTTTPLQEAGIFNEDNVMYNRVVFEPVKKTKSFKLMLVWEVTF